MNPLMYSTISVLLLLIRDAHFSTHLDNEIVTAPQIQCEPDRIVFSFNTRRPFKGNVYIRGYYDRENCRKRFDVPSVQGGILSIRLGDCGMTRMRQLVPLGISVHATFVANFHPIFATKEDRAFNVRCFYAHTESVVKADLDVNGPPEESLEKATTVSPDCKYTIREREYNGQFIRSTSLGTPIFHQWDCAADGNYGILIKSCSVLNSRNSQSIPMIDDKGCPIGDFPQIVYSSSLTSAYAVIEAISFPDDMSISFACQIKLCDKRLEECRGMSPPLCTNSLPVIKNELVELDNTILDTFGNLPEEPWMKEPSPPTEETENSTNINMLEMNSDGVTKSPRLNDDQWEIVSNHMERSDKRGKRLAKIKEIDVQTDKLFVNSALLYSNEKGQAANIRSPCVSSQALWLSFAVIGFSFIILIGILIYVATRFLKKKIEVEELNSSRSIANPSDYCYVNKFFHNVFWSIFIG